MSTVLNLKADTGERESLLDIENYLPLYYGQATEHNFCHYSSFLL